MTIRALGTHTDREYQSKLDAVRSQLEAMAGLVEEMLGHAVEALLLRDTALAKHIIEMDKDVNRAEIAIDGLCLLVLARWQPMASDLRFLTQSFKMVTDLERIGDLAVNIAERTIDLNNDEPLMDYADINAMADTVRSMIRDAIDAFLEWDAAQARVVYHRDDEVDEYYYKVFRDALEKMREDPANIKRGIHVQSIAKWLERMGDHATNLAEMVVFMAEGRDVRHFGHEM